MPLNKKRENTEERKKERKKEKVAKKWWKVVGVSFITPGYPKTPDDTT